MLPGNVLTDGDVVVEDVVSVVRMIDRRLSQDKDWWQSGVDASGYYGKVLVVEGRCRWR
jgi:hypothetical protein